MIKNFRFVEKNVLAGCRLPETFSQIDWLIHQGIRAIVSLEPLDEEIEQYIESQNLEHMNIFIPDGEEPTLEQVNIFLDFVSLQKLQHKPVLVHCLAGYGRTGTMLAIYLINQGQTVNEAMKLAGEPKTEDQLRFIYDYAEQFSKNSKQS